jgi:hypothetical protein
MKFGRVSEGCAGVYADFPISINEIQIQNWGEKLIPEPSDFINSNVREIQDNQPIPQTWCSISSSVICLCIKPYFSMHIILNKLYIVWLS